MRSSHAVAVVPVKDLSIAKRRLEGVSAGNRRQLSLAMLSLVLSTLKRVKGLDAIAVVSRDSDVINLTRSLDLRVLAERTNGLNEAIAESAHILVHEGASTMVVIPADVPLITPREVSRILEAQRGGASVTIVPDHNGTGTNALACSPPDAISPCFGLDSLENHANAAQDTGLALGILPLSGLALDVDTPDDLVKLSSQLPGASDYAALSAILNNIEDVDTGES